jgi:hypothetical protein
MRSHERSLARIEDYTLLSMECPQRNVVVVEQTESDAKRYNNRGWRTARRPMTSELTSVSLFRRAERTSEGTRLDDRGNSVVF